MRKEVWFAGLREVANHGTGPALLVPRMCWASRRLVAVGSRDATQRRSSTPQPDPHEPEELLSSDVFEEGCLRERDAHQACAFEASSKTELMCGDTGNALHGVD